MLGMLIAMWVIVMPVLALFAVVARNDKKRRARYNAHVEWVNSVNRANFEKLGVFI